MKLEISKVIEVLERTPIVLESLLLGLSDQWVFENEGEQTWSPFDVIGHLIHGESTDWIARLNIVMSTETDKNFTPFDRFAQFEESKGKSLSQLLTEFKQLRSKNLEILKSKNIQEADFSKIAIHPVFGEVTLAQLLSTWVVHDLNHIAQITRVMAKQYSNEVGPWIEFLRILK